MHHMLRYGLPLLVECHSLDFSATAIFYAVPFHDVAAAVLDSVITAYAQALAVDNKLYRRGIGIGNDLEHRALGKIPVVCHSFAAYIHIVPAHRLTAVGRDDSDSDRRDIGHEGRLDEPCLRIGIERVVEEREIPTLLGPSVRLAPILD